MSLKVLITPIKNSNCIAKPLSSLKNHSCADNTDKIPTKGTCGYDEKYGGGYSSAEGIASQIRNAVNNMGNQLKSIAQNQGLLTNEHLKQQPPKQQAVENKLQQPDNISKASPKDCLQKEAGLVNNTAVAKQESECRNNFEQASPKMVREQSINMSQEHSNYLPEELLYRDDIKESIDFSASLGYFNFGAGRKIKGSCYTIYVPSAYDYKTDVDYRELIAYSNDCTIKDYKESPIIISVEVNIVEVPISDKDFIIRQKNGAELTGRLFQDLSADNITAVRMLEHLSGGELKNTITIYSSKEKRIFRITVLFNKIYDNIESIVSRIFKQFTFNRRD